MFYAFDVLKSKHHKKMWCNGQNFRMKRLDANVKTYDSGITTVFQVINASSRGDRHPELSDLILWVFT